MKKSNAFALLCLQRGRSPPLPTGRGFLYGIKLGGVIFLPE